MPLHLQALGWIVVSTMTFSAVDEILCRGRPQADPVMECCRKDAGRLADAKMDCCQPARGENITPEQPVATRDPSGLDSASPLSSVIGFRPVDQAERHLLLAHSLPEGHPRRAVAAPLLI